MDYSKLKLKFSGWIIVILNAIKEIYYYDYKGLLFIFTLIHQHTNLIVW